ncbi:MAG: serine hydrolase [Bacteroidetes bacterium]|nr:serine hydrolase [Bacteroidota bacterium]
MKKFLLILLAIVIGVRVFLLLTGNDYILKVFYYNFAGIEDVEMFDSRTVASSHGEPIPYSSHYANTSLQEDFIKELEKLKTVSFIIVKNDSVLLEKYWEGYSDSSRSNIFSVSKSIIAALTGIAIYEGLIESVNDPVGKYLPYFNEDAKSRITLKHLLTMSSGLSWSEIYYSPFSDVSTAYYGDDLEKVIKDLKVSIEPGTKFRYKSGDAQIMGFVLREATGMSLSEYASRKLWKPIGAVHDATWSTDSDNGMEKAFCCFNTNTRDLAKFGLLYLHNGYANGRQIVSEEFIQESWTGCDIEDKNGVYTNYYGYFWWMIEVDGRKIFYARGILGQYVFIIPSENMVFVRLGHKRGDKGGPHPSDVLMMIEAVLDQFGSS